MDDFYTPGPSEPFGDPIFIGAITDEMVKRGLAVAQQHWALADADDVRAVLAAALSRNVRPEENG